MNTLDKVLVIFFGGADMHNYDYDQLTAKELQSYYERVRGYIEQGFRVDGLKEELELIYIAMKKRNGEHLQKKEKYLQEISHYIRTIRL